MWTNHSKPNFPRVLPLPVYPLVVDDASASTKLSTQLRIIPIRLDNLNTMSDESSQPDLEALTSKHLCCLPGEGPLSI